MTNRSKVLLTAMVGSYVVAVAALWLSSVAPQMTREYLSGLHASCPEGWDGPENGLCAREFTPPPEWDAMKLKPTPERNS